MPRPTSCCWGYADCDCWEIGCGDCHDCHCMRADCLECYPGDEDA